MSRNLGEADGASQHRQEAVTGFPASPRRTVDPMLIYGPLSAKEGPGPWPG
jgi:hypothetical protein